MSTELLHPLKSLKVLDLSRLLPGPYCTHLLAKLGAKVTAIHQPNDEFATFSYQEDLRGGQKNITLDLKTPLGISKVKKMISKVDLIVEGFRPGTLTRLGLSFATLKELNPNILLCSIYGFSKEKESHAGHDINFIAASGLLSALFPNQAPKLPAVLLGDLIGGMSAALKILAVLQQKKSGAQHLKISITDEIRAFYGPTHLKTQQTLKPIIEERFPRYHLYQTKDSRWLAVAPVEQKFFEKFANILEIPKRILSKGDPSLLGWLKKIFKTKTQSEWVSILSDPDLCVTAVV